MIEPRRPFHRCADRDTWQDLLDEKIDEADQPALLAHLDTCPACTQTVAELAAEWSLATRQDRRTNEGPATQAIRERIVGTHALPPPPAIPDIADLTLAGRGGMGAVYRGRDTRLDRPVAVKVLAGAGVFSPSSRARLEREARVLARLDHPNIVRINSAGVTDGVPYIVMEWIDGRTLQRRISEAVLPPREAARIALALAESVAAVHAVGIVHRDIKPDNVLLAAGGGADSAEVPKLADFGLARPDNAGDGITRTTSALGTPCFMAPEQTGLEPALGGVGPATDIHALGGLLYAMLAGRPPYDAPTPGESLRRAARADAPSLATLVPGMPTDLRTIVETCLHYEPHHRYRTAAALADDLAGYLAGRSIAARPAGPETRLRAWIRQRPALATAAVLGCLLVVAGIGGSVFYRVNLSAAHAATAASRDATRDARNHAQQSLARLTDDTIEAMLLRGPALGERDRDFLRSIRDELRRWPLEPDAAVGLAFRADGLDRVARLFYRVHRPDEALECVEAILETLDAMEKLAPDTDAVFERRIAALEQQRHYLFQVGRLEDSQAAARRAIAALEQRSQTDPAMRVTLAVALLDLANSIDTAGQGVEARPLVARALTLLAEAARERPDDAGRLEAEVKALYNAALLSARHGSVDERRERLTLLVDRCTTGLQSFPREDATWHRGLLLGLTALAAAEFEAGRVDEAIAFAERRSVAADTARAAHPAEPSFVGERVDAAVQVYCYRDALGRGVESASDLDQAVRLAAEAVEREPAVYDRSWLLGLALEKQSHLLELRGESASAVAARDRLAAALAPWQDRVHVAGMIAGQCAASARLLAAAGDRSAAVARLERAAAVAPAQIRPAILTELAAMKAANAP